jgi:hypothetical protein
MHLFPSSRTQSTISISRLTLQRHPRRHPSPDLQQIVRQTASYFLRGLISLLDRNQVAKHAIHSASFDAAEHGDPPKCHPDTRLVVQDSLKFWPTAPADHPIAAGSVRWISGWAGTGKTTIAQTMAKYWAECGLLAASFFFLRSSTEKSTTENFSLTILHQLLRILDFPEMPRTLPRDWLDVVSILRPMLPLSKPMVIVIDGLDECHSIKEQVKLLRTVLKSVDQLGPSIKFLISCRPERHLESVFEQFILGPSYHIYLGQSREDNDDIRTFLRLSFDRICEDRRKDNTMSITDELWPTDEQIQQLVDRASGQFIFAATLVAFVDDEEEDPVRLLDGVLERQLPSFASIDALYLVILERVIKSTPSHHHQLVHDLLLHINYEPSSAADVAQFWFQKQVDVNICVRHLGLPE